MIATAIRNLVEAFRKEGVSHGVREIVLSKEAIMVLQKDKVWQDAYKYTGEKELKRNEVACYEKVIIKEAK